jgi:hypothetical protein
MVVNRESSYCIFLSGKGRVFRGIMLGRGVPNRSVSYIHVYTYIYVYTCVYIYIYIYLYIYEDSALLLY